MWTERGAGVTVLMRGCALALARPEPSERQGEWRMQPGRDHGSLSWQALRTIDRTVIFFKRDVAYVSRGRSGCCLLLWGRKHSRR